MKKALIICHDFPPLNSVAAQRPASWLKELPSFDISSVVITYRWNEDIFNQEEKHMKQDDNEVKVLEENREIHAIHRLETKRDKLIRIHGLDKRKLLRKTLTFRDQFLSFFTTVYGANAGLFNYADEYIRKNHVDVIIVTGGPFILFKYGHLLSKKHSLPWIADFRDEWINNHGNSGIKLMDLLLHPLNVFFQKRWTNNCLFFTSVSPPLKERIQHKIKKDGFVIRNGIDKTILPEKKPERSKCFTLFYGGTLYDSKYMEILCNGLDKFLAENSKKEDFKFVTAGIMLNRTKGTDRFIEFQKKYPEHIDILDTMKQKAVLQLESESTVMLNLVPTSLSNGIYTVKLYEFLALEKPILNIESHSSQKNNEFSEYVINCYNEESFKNNLNRLYLQWKDGDILTNPVSGKTKIEISRQRQAEKLAQLINSHVSV